MSTAFRLQRAGAQASGVHGAAMVPRLRHRSARVSVWRPAGARLLWWHAMMSGYNLGPKMEIFPTYWLTLAVRRHQNLERGGDGEGAGSGQQRQATAGSHGLKRHPGSKQYVITTVRLSGTHESMCRPLLLPVWLAVAAGALLRCMRMFPLICHCALSAAWPGCGGLHSQMPHDKTPHISPLAKTWMSPPPSASATAS